MNSIKKINEIVKKTNRPIKTLQFGEGNFLRAFVDWMVDIANGQGLMDNGIMIVKPIPFGGLGALNGQDCIYTVLLRGKQGGETINTKRAITSVMGALDCYSQYDMYSELAKAPELRFIVSNTTEAGIVFDSSDSLSLTPPKSYPGKLTKFLYERWQAFNGDGDKGLIILPVELIERNGAALRECCEKLCALWNLPEGFVEWLNNSNIFCQTLVDRIVTGYPKDMAGEIEAGLGYEDKLMVAGEPFALWVIESTQPEVVKKELPFDKAGLPVIFTDNLQPYRERKVRILNGAHTSTVLSAYLAGLDTVGELMGDVQLRRMLEHNVYTGLAPYVPLPAGEVKEFSDSVMERFENPFIKHSLLSISLNSVSKFKSRVLPTILEAFEGTGSLPEPLCFALSSLMAFYSGEMRDGRLFSKRGAEEYEIMDDKAVLEFFADNKNLPADKFAEAFLKREDFWGRDLSEIQGFADAVGRYLQGIRDKGIRKAIESVLSRWIY
ncbi:MAG: tagaturonate reductase [Clostridiales bacterium]|nr:tagaturonate reductase [Clostridiales bacterium]